MTEAQFKRLRQFFTVAILLSCLAQFFIYPDSENGLCAILLAGGSLVLGSIFLRKEKMRRYLLSTSCVLYFIFISLTLPLIGRTIGGKDVVTGLFTPIKTFLWVSGAAVSLALGHYMYQNANAILKGVSVIRSHVLRPLGLFDDVGPGQLWFVGLVGFSATAYNCIAFGYSSTEKGGVVGAIVRGLMVYTPAPYIQLLPFSRIKSSNATKVALVLYTIGLLGLSLLRNSRAAVIDPLFTLTLCLIVGAFADMYRLKIKWKTVIATGLIALVVYLPLSVASKVIVAVRGARGRLSASELVQKSIEAAFSDSTQSKYEKALAGDQVWTEDYYTSEFMNRLSNPKYHDNMIRYGGMTTDSEKEMMWNYAFQRSLSVLPAPVIEPLGFNVDKDTTLAGSSGDYVYDLVAGHGYGGYRTGSYVGIGATLMGIWLFPVTAVLSMFVFMLLDTFTGMVNNRYTICLVALIAATPLVGAFGVRAEGMEIFALFLVREYAQLIVLYFIMVSLSRMAVPAAFRGRRRKRGLEAGPSF